MSALCGIDMSRSLHRFVQGDSSPGLAHLSRTAKRTLTLYIIGISLFPGTIPKGPPGGPPECGVPRPGGPIVVGCAFMLTFCNIAVSPQPGTGFPVQPPTYHQWRQGDTSTATNRWDGCPRPATHGLASASTRRFDGATGITNPSQSVHYANQPRWFGQEPAGLQW